MACVVNHLLVSRINDRKTLQSILELETVTLAVSSVNG